MRTVYYPSVFAHFVFMIFLKQLEDSLEQARQEIAGLHKTNDSWKKQVDYLEQKVNRSEVSLNAYSCTQ